MPGISTTHRDHYRQIFEQCDENKDEKVCIKELKAFLRSKEHTKDLPEAKIKYIFELADKDGNKEVNLEEFIYMLEHPDLKHLFAHWVDSYIHFLLPQQKPEKKIIPRGRRLIIESHAELQETLPLQRRTSVEESKAYILIEEEEEIAYIDHFSCCPPPLGMILISILELIFFVIDETNEKRSTLTGTGITAIVLIYNPGKRYQVWRFLTYMFVHIGHMHMIVNLAIQLLLGIPLEMVHKWWRVGIIYFSGVIAGSLATSITDPRVRLAGASGGVYSLLTAHIATIVMNWSEMIFPHIQILIFGIIVSCDIGSSFYDRYFLNVNDQVGYSAHFGGAVAGLLVGIYTLKNLNVKRCEKYLWWAALVAYITFIILAILLNVFLPKRYPTS